MRLRRAITIAVFLFLLSSAASANSGVLKGVVRENEVGGRAVPNVPISAQGANPTATEEALKIYRELAQKNPDTFLAGVAMTLNNLGVLDRLQNRVEQARLNLQEALDIYQRLAASNPNRFAKDVDRVKVLMTELPAAK